MSYCVISALLALICGNFITSVILFDELTSESSNLVTGINRDNIRHDSNDVGLFDPEFEDISSNNTARRGEKTYRRIFIAPIQRRHGTTLPSESHELLPNSTAEYTVLLHPSSTIPLTQLTTRRNGALSPPKATISSSRHLAATSAAAPVGESAAAGPRSTPSLLIAHPIAAAIIVVLVLAMILVTVVGNCMVCLAICMVRKLKQQPANLLLVSLAVADFSVGLIVMPIALVGLLEQRWILGELMCRLWTSADLTLCTASILNLCVISVDRYLAVTRTLRYAVVRTRARMLLYVGVVWVSALLVSATPLIFFPTRSIVEQTCQVSQNLLYQFYATVISFYAPCLIMVIVYGKMWRAAKRIQRHDRQALNCSVRPSLQSSGSGRRHCDSNESSTTVAGGSATVSPRDTSRPKRHYNNNNHQCNEVDRNNNSKNRRYSSTRLPFLLGRWWEVKKNAQTPIENGSVQLMPNDRRRSTVMMVIPESTTIEEDTASEQNNDDHRIDDSSLKSDNHGDINSNKMTAERWLSERELRRATVERTAQNGAPVGASNGARHPRKKFRQMFSSPLLFSDGAMRASVSSVTTTVAAAVVHRIQRPSALLSAVRMPLLRASHDKGEDKARKTLGVIMSVFIVCWLPFFILALVKPQYPQYSIPTWLDMVALWLGYSNSMLNPLIYCKYNREFRVPFREMLCCRCRTLQVVMRNESFYTKFGPPKIVAELRNLTYASHSKGDLPSNGNSGDRFEFGAAPLSPPPAAAHLTRDVNSKRNSSPCAIELTKGRVTH